MNTLLLHGPFQGNMLKKIYNNYISAKQLIDEVVIVCYFHDIDYYKDEIKKYSLWNDVKFVIIKDLLNPGFFNINRQIYSVKAGLTEISSENFVIKLRNDQSVDFNKLFTYMKKYHYDNKKIITTNCFTRYDRLYHPSDMFLAAPQKLLKQYYSCPLMNATHLDHILEQQYEYKKDPTINYLKIVPESYLFRNFLISQNWQIKETFNDYWDALKKYIFLLNSWDINYCWYKKRTPYLKSGSMIYPGYFTMRPFENGPLERCRCICRNELNGTTASLKDLYFKNISKFLFSLKYGSYRSLYQKNKIYLLKIIKNVVKIFPYFIAKSIIKKINQKIERKLFKLNLEK